MRVVLMDKDRDLYFMSIKAVTKLTWTAISKKLKVNIRELYDWRRGKYSIPFKFCRDIEKIYKISFSKSAVLKKEFAHTKDAGKKGGNIRYILYGNPGTIYGRKLGGERSVIVNKNIHTAFDNIKKINTPKRSTKLAEALGILIGDGGISAYQVKISLDINADKDYVPFVKNLFEKLFKIKVAVNIRKKESVIELVLSSKRLVALLFKYGLPIGNKIKHNITIPVFINGNIALSRACMRGIFDTDGSVYFDTHTIKGKLYRNINIALTSYSTGLLHNIEEILLREGLNPTHSSKNSIRIRRSEEVVKFFDIIGSNNPKNNQKYFMYMD